MEKRKKKKKNHLKYGLGILVILILIIGIYQISKQQEIKPNLTYVEKEVQNTIKRVKETKNENTVSINFITDLHINEEEENIYLNNVKAFTDLANTGLLDLSISGGDLYYGTWQNRGEGKANLRYTKLLFGNVKTPMLYVRGNHDCNIKKNPAEAISDEDYYNIMLKQLKEEVTFNEKDPYGGYYYKDLEKQKVRICVLNAFQGENYQYIFGDTQLEFVATDMLNLENKKNPDEWQVLFFTHTIENSIAHQDFVEDKEKLYEIITAYKNASTVSVQDKKIDYTKQKKRIVIGIITGHHHLDLEQKEHDIQIISTRSASVASDRATNLEAVKGTKEELAFDTYTIDLQKRTIKVIRTGRGEDRNFSY